MPQVQVTTGDVHVNGHFSAKTMDIPSGTVINDDVSASAAIAHTKMQHRHVINYQQSPSSAVVAGTEGLWIARAGGTIVAVEAMITGTIATGNDRTVTVDVKKGNAGNAYATILSAGIELDDDDALRTGVAGTLSTTTFLDGDSFQVVVAVAGGNGNQALGLLVTLTVVEDAS